MLAFVMWGEDCVDGLLSLLLLSVSCGVMIFGCDGGFFWAGSSVCLVRCGFFLWISLLLRCCFVDKCRWVLKLLVDCFVNLDGKILNLN